MEETYTPISCSFYDRLEAAATLKKRVELQYFSNSGLETIKTTIHTFKTKNKIEFMVLDGGLDVRLDKIHSLDGIELKNHC